MVLNELVVDVLEERLLLELRGLSGAGGADETREERSGGRGFGRKGIGGGGGGIAKALFESGGALTPARELVIVRGGLLLFHGHLYWYGDGSTLAVDEGLPPRTDCIQVWGSVR